MTRAAHALLLVVLTVALAGCGGDEAARIVTEPRLAGWETADDPPGISQLAPDLAGLELERLTDARALVRGGDVIRASSFRFATAKEAEEAQKRGSGDDYERALEEAFRADARARPDGFRLMVDRPAEGGTDSLEIAFVRNGRTLTVVELVSARGFPPALRAQALAAVSRLRTTAG